MVSHYYSIPANWFIIIIIINYYYYQSGDFKISKSGDFTVSDILMAVISHKKIFSKKKQKQKIKIQTDKTLRKNTFATYMLI